MPHFLCYLIYVLTALPLPLPILGRLRLLYTRVGVCGFLRGAPDDSMDVCALAASFQCHDIVYRFALPVLASMLGLSCVAPLGNGRLACT